MKKAITLITILMINLTSCTSVPNNNQSINSNDSKVVADFSYDDDSQKSKSNIEKDNETVDIQNSQSLEEEVTDDEDTNNEYFFKDVANKKNYKYKGTVWGEFVVNGDKPEKTNDEGEVYVTANLTVSQIAKLKQGNIYELNFAIVGEANNTKERDEKAYFWVTDDKIYEFSPPKDFDYKEFVGEDGEIDNLKCIKAIEKDGNLPNDDEDLLRCSNKSINLSDDKIRPKDIVVESTTCKYSYFNGGSSTYNNIIWKKGTGIIHYSWGYGAKKYGMRLDLV